MAFLRSRAHVVVLVAGMVAVGLVTVLVAIHVSTIALDETIYKQSAVHYTSGLPHSLFHDLTARGTARLYSLILAPLFAVFDGDVAVRWARALTALMFAATAIPVYLVARDLVRSRWGAVAAALGSIAAPWLTLGTAMFSEGLSLLLFAWTLVAMRAALSRPAWWRDALVLAGLVALLCTRVQLGALLPAWLIVVIVWEVRAAHESGLGVWDASFVLRRAIRHHPLTMAGAAAGVAGVLVLLAKGTLHYRIQAVFGRYSEIQDRQQLPSDAGLATFFEVVAFSVGVGLIPAIMALAWLRGALSGRLGRDQFEFALMGCILLAILFAGTMLAQNGYLGINSEERYYIYVLPLLWIGAIVAFEDERVSRRWMAAAGGGLVLLAATVDVGAVQLDADRFFLAPAAATVNHLSPRVMGRLQDLLGLNFVVGRRDLLMYVCLLVTALTVLLVRSRRARWVLAGLAIVFQLGMTAYAFQGTRGHLAGVHGGRTRPVRFAALGWVDRATPGHPNVAWLDNQVRTPAYADQERTIDFYNDEIKSVTTIPQQMLTPVGSPLDALPVTPMLPATTVIPAAPTGWFVSERNSPLLQLSGRPVATGYGDQYQLQHVTARDHVAWIAAGLDDDGIVAAAQPARMLAPSGTRATLVLVRPTPAASSVIVSAAGHSHVVRFSPRTAVRTLTLRLCSAHGAVPVVIRTGRTVRLPDKRQAGGAVRAVRVAPIRC